MLLPSSVGSVAHPDLLLGGTKDGTVYLIDRNNMGKFGTTDDMVQEVTGQFNSGQALGIYATAAYAGGLIYLVGPLGPAKAFSIADGMMSPAPVSQSPDSFAYNGSTPSLSSNGLLGGINGIVWDLDLGTNELRAYSSVSYGTELYNSDQAPNGRDALGTAVKFGVPTVANGRVFIGTAGGDPNNDLVAYGIISPPNAAPAAPTDLAATTVGTGQINLAWTDHDVAPNWADSYSVESSTDGTDFNPIATLSAGTTAFTVTGLSPNTTYDFRVRAANSLGDSCYTDVAGATTGSAPTLSPIPDQTMTSSQGPLTVTLAGSHPDGDALTYSAGVESMAYHLDQTLGLFSNGNYYDNWGGEQEKWLQGNGGVWYFILPSGAFYQWNGSGGANGTLLATVDPSYWANPYDLWHAPISWSVSGNALALAPAAGYVGSFWVTATVDDGQGGTASQSFMLTVTS
jgi:hypothetical protein